MVKIEKIFFCDQIEEGQFNKLNITWLIATNSISFETVPYRFVTFMVISGKVYAQAENLSIKITTKDCENSIVNNFTFDVAMPATEIINFTPLFAIYPLQIDIHQFGFLSIEIIEKESLIYDETYAITQGLSPYIKTAGHLPVAKLFHGQNQMATDFIVNLLGTANRSLKIFDNYISPKDLIKLLSKVHKTVKIQIITQSKNKTNFWMDTLLNRQFSNIEIRFSDKSHDRFVTINDSEYYHFGYSLKDLAREKMSRCSKITSKSEIGEYEAFFNETWGLS